MGSTTLNDIWMSSNQRHHELTFQLLH
jgi:hypothetical protein